MTNWRVYHRGNGKRDGPSWYTKFEDVPDWKKKVIKETMFSTPSTTINNDPDLTPEEIHDPLNLKRCLRIFPHDDNQGGFFVAVFEKILDTQEGLVNDEMYEMNAWDDPNVR